MLPMFRPMPASGAVRAGVFTLVGVVLVCLAVSFVEVLRRSVAQGEQLRRDFAEDADATWRCRALRGVASREACFAQLRPMRPAREQLSAR